MWPRKKRSKDGGEPELRPQLADECEAYVHGRYLELYQEISVTTPGRTPAWVRLNEVAHAPLETLRAVGARAKYDGAATWDDARACIAGLLVDAAHGDADLARRLQLDVLQPLEARFSGVAELVTPRRMVEIVDSCLVSRDA